MIDVIIVIVIRMQNHKCNEMENAFQIFKLSCLRHDLKAFRHVEDNTAIRRLIYGIRFYWHTLQNQY